MAQDISKEQYEFALARIEELLPVVDDNTSANDGNALELTMMSDVVIDYEKEHYPIVKPLGKENDNEHSAPHSLVMFNRDGMRQKSVLYNIIIGFGFPLVR